MAKAQRYSDVRKQFLLNYSHDETDVVLVMNKDEAQALQDILINVGGDPAKTRRHLAESISTALEEAGVAHRYGRKDVEGTIRFKPSAIEQVWERVTPSTQIVEVLAVDDEEARRKLSVGEYVVRHNSSGPRKDWERVS